MKNKILIIFVFAFLLVGTFAFASAQTTNSASYPADNWFGRIVSYVDYNILKQGGYTALGQSMGCSSQPISSPTFENTQTTVTISIPQGQELIDFFRGSPTDGAYSSHLTDSRQFLKEYLVTASSPVTLYCDSGSYWNKQCYYDIYSCPLVAPTQSTNHTTAVYSCSNGQQSLVYNVNQGSPNWCSDSSNNNYIIPGSSSDGVCYPTSQAPLICSQLPKINVQKGITIDQLNSETSADLLKSICTSSAQCASGSCTTLYSLQQSGAITSAQSQGIINNVQKDLGISTLQIGGTATGAVVATAICTGLVAAGTVVTAGASAAIFPLCGIVGGAIGYGASTGIQDIYNNVQASNTQKIGYCIVQNDFWSGTLFSLGSFNVTGTILVIAIVIFLLLIMLMRR